MSCDRLDTVFQLYDGALSGEEKTAAERHLAVCPECRRAVEEWKHLAGKFCPPVEAEVSAEFEESIMARIAPEPERSLFRRLADAVTMPKLVLAGALSAAVALLLLRPFSSSPVVSVSPECTAFVAELVYDNSSVQDPYDATSEYLFGS